ncbi:MAG: hypothetical protein IJ594_02785 [Oscillospiraceae bacterium]|nr:hypothetical protein [Oscillospiraceae bacterium]
MKARYDRTYEYGRSMAKYMMIAAVVIGVSALFVPSGSVTQKILIVASFLVILATIYVMYRYCRCPYCGKHIIAGALVVSSCPACRRDLSTGKRVKKR